MVHHGDVKELQRDLRAAALPRHEGDDRGEVAAGARAANGQLARVDAELGGMLGGPPRRGVRIVGRRGIAMLGREPVFDGQHRASGSVRERTAEVVGERDAADDPAATVEIDDQRQRSGARTVQTGGDERLLADRDVAYLGHLFERDRRDGDGAAADPRLLDGELLDAARIRRRGLREELSDLGINWQSRYRTAPGPLSARPGRALVCSPSFSTCTPLTNTSRTPVAYFCGSS